MSDAIIEQFGVVTADSQTADAGQIEVVSETTSILGGDSVTSARSESAQGGTVHALGEQVGLFDEARIDVSGATGGGTALIGGDYKGGGGIQSADATFVSSNSVITADALDNGDGGSVIVWADTVTKFYGVISARGGENGGDGGFVETSGKEILIALGQVDASAPSGVGGTWLLDPRQKTIDDATQERIDESGGDPNVFTANADSAIVDVANMATSLNAGTSVTIRTDAAGATPQEGDIIWLVGADLNKTTGGAATLTLEAVDSIFINSAITSTSNTLNVVLHADTDQDLTGPLTQEGILQVTSTGPITTNGGNVTLIGRQVILAADVTTAGGNVNITLPVENDTLNIVTGSDFDPADFVHILAGAGTVTIGQATGVAGQLTTDMIAIGASFDATPTATLMDLALIADSGITIDQALTVDVPLSINTDFDGDGAGALDIENDGATTFGAITTTNKDLTITADDVILETAGAGLRIDAGTLGNVSITTSHKDTDIRLGVAGGGATDLDIVDAELAKIGSNDLNLATIDDGATGGDFF